MRNPENPRKRMVNWAATPSRCENLKRRGNSFATKAFTFRMFGENTAMPLPKPKIKVFRAHLGFYDTIVAVTSRLKALAAWGASGDLFAHGGAEETKDPDAVRAATARPGVILR